MLNKTLKGAILGCVMIGSVAAVATVASRAATTADGIIYFPMQAISQDLGSKSTVGYFIPEAGACHIVLMIAENVDPEAGAMPSATRLRLTLQPGQAAGLDSEEGHTMDLTCGEGADTVTVLRGELDAAAVATN